MPEDVSGQEYSLERLVADVSVKLGSPKGFANKVGFVYQELLGRLEHYATFVQTFGGNWLLARTELNLYPGRDEYDVQESDFARPLWCETVPPVQTAFARYTPARIDVVSLDDLQRWDTQEVGAYGNFGQNVGDAGAVMAPRCVAFWLEDGEPKLRFNVSPRHVLKVRVFYEPAIPLLFNPSERPKFLPNFFELLRNATALECLPLFDFDDRQYERLSQKLQPALARSEALLEKYAMNDHEETAGPIRGWGEGRAQSSPFFVR